MNRFVPPRATMRLQFHKDFTFAQAEPLLAYFVDLGISHIYASPILTARAGSIHGYDVVDPTAVNPELGGEDGFRSFVQALRNAGLGLVVDIVPNHMAVGGADNPWWLDVLRYGRNSVYAGYFDIDWDCADAALHGKVLAPFLGQPYGEALASGDIRLDWPQGGDPIIRYFDNAFPIDPTDFPHIEECGRESFDPITTSGQEMLHALLERQHYRLAWWGVAGDEINWRRFFDINGLAGLRIEVSDVFEATHAKLFELYRDGLIDGFRVDHVDGLSDPPAYCRRLRERLLQIDPKRQPYLVIEKILGAGETLPTDWQVDGTSGYDFMNEVSAVQHDPGATELLQTLWHAWTGRTPRFEDEESAARLEILQRGFEAQLSAVTAALHHLVRLDLRTRDISAAALRRGLMTLLAHFPVYRTYNAGTKRSGLDDASFHRALKAAKAATPASGHVALDCLDRLLGGQQADKASRLLSQIAGTRFQQLSAPVAAKSVEDTAFYRYGRLLSRNDVGFDAARLGSSVEDFHDACKGRLASFPAAMLATATHDHKRGEDLRARLAVISEIPRAWEDFVNASRDLGGKAPSPADEIMLYQMIVGAWPLDLHISDHQGRAALAERLAGWQQKALREAKLRTDWTAPNKAYETLARDFLMQRLAPGGGFLPLAERFIAQIAPAGAVNGLVQTVLKLTVPGMPDFFQGTEFWDFSLVDPDNRRPVDYQSRQVALSGHEAPAASVHHWRDGRVKQATIHTLLGLRRRLPDLFAAGAYLPLRVSGRKAERFIAFARVLDGSAVVVIVPRLVHDCLDPVSLSLKPDDLKEHTIELPDKLGMMSLQSLFSNSQAPCQGNEYRLAPLLSDMPYTVLYSA